MKRMSLVTLLVAMSLMAGCATILSGKTQNISINSNVDGADITLDGTLIGKTPFAGVINKPKGTAGSSITVSKAGYTSKTIMYGAEIEPTFWINILTGGPFGSTTDMATNSMYKYAPASINVDLVKLGN